MASIIELRPGARLSQFKIKALLAKSQMSVVYGALDSTGREVLIKTTTIKDPYGRHRSLRPIGFLRNERDVLARDIDPIFPKLVAYGKSRDGEFLAMEKINGTTVKDLAESLSRDGEEITIPRTIEIIMQVCFGLNALHKANLVHRDIKPAHIMVQDADGMARLIDLGIACKIGHKDSDDLTIGTPRFMSPEQYNYQPIDQRTDVFSTGMVFNMMISGWGLRPRSGDITKPIVEKPCRPRPIKPTLIGAKLGFEENEILSLMPRNKKMEPVKERIGNLTELINEIVFKMTAESIDERLTKIDEAVPMLERAKELAESLS